MSTHLMAPGTALPACRLDLDALTICVPLIVAMLITEALEGVEDKIVIDLLSMISGTLAGRCCSRHGMTATHAAVAVVRASRAALSSVCHLDVFVAAVVVASPLHNFIKHVLLPLDARGSC